MPAEIKFSLATTDQEADYLSHETWGERVEVHRDAAVFGEILPRYERWRIGLPGFVGPSRPA